MNKHDFISLNNKMRFNTIYIKLLFSILTLFLYSCLNLTNKSKMSNENISFNKLFENYSNEYFIGIGTGKGNTESMALQIAKSRALGELSDNIKVSILSELEVISKSVTQDNLSDFDEDVKESIISIGNATVRLPEYEILNVEQSGNEYYVKVMAKKLISEQINDASKSLELEDAGEILLKSMVNKIEKK